ncbi:MAG: aldo/keto reductase, partial [Paramuribaculum sp.]|nr:aldo/keto reductase [Paramuribaculum sp.]
RFVDLAEMMSVKPAVNQIEVNVFAQQHFMQEVCEKYGTHLMAWGPLAEGANDFFSNSVLTEIGAKYGKSVAQVALRYLVKRNIIVIPKSIHKERMEQNFNILDFNLSEEDIKAISTLDLGHGVVVNFEDARQRLGLFDIIKQYKV